MDQPQSDALSQPKQDVPRRDALVLMGSAAAAVTMLAVSASQSAEDKPPLKPMTGVPQDVEKVAKKLAAEMIEKIKLADKNIKTVDLRVEIASPQMVRRLVIQTKKPGRAERGDPYVSNPDPNDSTRCD